MVSVGVGTITGGLPFEPLIFFLLVVICFLTAGAFAIIGTISLIKSKSSRTLLILIGAGLGIVGILVGIPANTLWSITERAIEIGFAIGFIVMGPEMIFIIAAIYGGPFLALIGGLLARSVE